MSIDTATTALVTSINNYGNAINTKKLNAVGGKIAGYVENALHVANTGANVSLDASKANIFDIALSTTAKLAFTNVPTSDAANNKFISYSVTVSINRSIANAIIDFSGLTITWQDQTPPDQSTAVGKVDVIVLTTENGGTSWFGYVSGTNR